MNLRKICSKFLGHGKIRADTQSEHLKGKYDYTLGKVYVGNLLRLLKLTIQVINISIT